MKLIPSLAAIDRRVIQETGVSAIQLMENAGIRVAEAVKANCSPRQGGVILCGPGNNGGDGFVCAKKLHEMGFSNVNVVYTGRQYRNESLHHFEMLMALPVPVISANEQTNVALNQIAAADFIVDALFGSGLSRPVEGIEAQLIDAVNRKRREPKPLWVLAVDLPSGIDSATGQPMGAVLQANQTITFGAYKPGLFLPPGHQAAGRFHVADIGLPARFIQEEESALALLTTPQARYWLPHRRKDSHKYDYGNILVIAGSHAMPGAAILCSEAAMSAGAGLVTLAAANAVFQQLPLMPEVMRLPLPDENYLTEASVGVLETRLHEGKYNTVLLGPGLGREPETLGAIAALLDFLATSFDGAVIVDADGLYALAQDKTPLNPRFILTPHVGECARLLDSTAGELSANLPQAAQMTRERFQAQVVLKSSATLIATVQPDAAPAQATCWLSPLGNPGMATAGSGDVLAGIIAAMSAQCLAQQRPLWQAAPLGVYLHGLAGDAAAAALSQYAMRASDITRHLPNAFKVLSDLPDNSSG